MTGMETVAVTQLSKHGLFADKQGYYWSKQLKDADKVNVVPGRTFQMEIYTAASGVKYVNKILNQIGQADVPAAKPVAAAAPVAAPVAKAPYKAKAKDDETMTRADWDAKDRRISRQGLIQAAVQAVSSYSTQENHYSNAESLALQMLEFVGK